MNWGINNMSIRQVRRMDCSKHPKYKILKAPTSKCLRCWGLYLKTYTGPFPHTGTSYKNIMKLSNILLELENK